MAPARTSVQAVSTEAPVSKSVVTLEAVLEVVKRTAGNNEIDADAPLMEAGIDSLGAVELRNVLQRAAGEGVVLSSTLMFDYPTARQVALHLRGTESPIARPVGDNADAALAQSVGEVEVAGLSVVLPANLVDTESELCNLYRATACSMDLLCEIPLARWDAPRFDEMLVDSPPEVRSRVRHGGFLIGAELFEHTSFSISAAEAAAMDPQQRQLLERGYASLHAAGLSRSSLMGAVVAVNVGQWASEYQFVLMGVPAGQSVYAATGFACSVTCGRVSFVLGLQGPCASYDTACSASLVGNHSSIRALQRNECSTALSSGVK